MLNKIGDRGTVFSRMKTNGGFLTSPFHVFGSTMQNPGAKKPGLDPDQDEDNDADPNANPDASTDAPNYREAEDPKQSCQDCGHLNVDDECEKYNFTPKLYFVCDSFEPANDDDASLEDPSSNALPVGKGGGYLGN